MNSENIVKNVTEILEKNGLAIYENEDSELQYDSLQFISIISELEETFSIYVPDEAMTGENLNTLDDFCSLVKCCM